jgi:hypothetical protein
VHAPLNRWRKHQGLLPPAPCLQHCLNSYQVAALNGWQDPHQQHCIQVAQHALHQVTIADGPLAMPTKSKPLANTWLPMPLYLPFPDQRQLTHLLAI